MWGLDNASSSWKLVKSSNRSGCILRNLALLSGPSTMALKALTCVFASHPKCTNVCVLWSGDPGPFGGLVFWGFPSSSKARSPTKACHFKHIRITVAIAPNLDVTQEILPLPSLPLLLPFPLPSPSPSPSPSLTHSLTLSLSLSVSLLSLSLSLSPTVSLSLTLCFFSPLSLSPPYLAPSIYTQMCACVSVLVVVCIIHTHIYIYNYIYIIIYIHVYTYIWIYTYILCVYIYINIILCMYI